MSIEVSESALQAEAERALAFATSDPRRASKLAQDVLIRALPARDFRATSLAERTLGMAARECHDLSGSALHLRRAARIAERAGMPPCGAEARLSLAGTLALQGNWAGAKREVDRAGRVLRGVMAARVETQRAYLHLNQGHLDEALECFRRALPVLRRGGDRLGEAHALALRALAYFMKGAVAAAEVDLRQAEDLYVAIGERVMTVETRQHLGLVVALRGDIPEALAAFDRAEEYLRHGDASDVMGLIDRSEVLLRARLVAEARTAAETAVGVLADKGGKAYLAIAQLQLAEVALVQNDLATARTMADLALATFSRQRRTSWATIARYLSVRAAWLSGERSPAVLAAARVAARRLAAAGFATASYDARLLAAQISLDQGRPEVARQELAHASCSSRRSPVQLRVRSWHAQAMLRLAEGNRPGAERALLAGVRLLERYRAALGATELRAHASGHGADLACLGITLAISDENPERTLAWIERWRAGAVRLPPARPPDDKRLADELGELRAAVTATDLAALAGKPTARLQARQAGLEKTVRDLARHATGLMAALVVPTPTVPELKRAVGDHALIEIVVHEGLLHAVVLAGGRVTLHQLGAAPEVESEVRLLRYSLRRLAYGGGSEAALGAAGNAASWGADRLDAMLLGPLAADLADRPLVIVPPGWLHVVPWSLLPSCHGRAVSVAPSAAMWHRAVTAGRVAGVGSRPGAGRVALVAGPGLLHAVPEVLALARQYPQASRLSGAKATCGAVAEALDGAELAHVASHGRFRADSPMFSSLQLADGPLTVYDLEALKDAPKVLILSACDSGLSDVQPGDELMGLAAALFALGTRTLIASVAPVPDGASRRLMRELHTGLRAGLDPASALARAQTRVAPTGPEGRAAAAGFVCFGAGSTPKIG